MVLPIDKTIDLTLYENNPAPKLVQSLSIIHEAEQGEVVQYYIEPESKLQGDKNSYAEAKYNKDTDSYDYYDYDEITWGTPRRRIATRKMDRLGLKAFPGVGAIAFYKLAYQVWSKIVAPVNNPKRLYPSPIMTMTASALSLHFELSPPSDKVTYICYRITLRSGEYAEEYITYDSSFDCGMPKMNGEYEAYAQGYIEEGEEASELSPSVFFTCNVPGQSSDRPTTTEGSDIFVAGLRFTQDNKLLATLTDGRTVESSNIVPEELPTVGVSDKGKFLMVDSTGKWAAIEFATIVDPIHHQLLRYNSVTGKWENFTSMDPDAPESAAHIVDVIVKGSKKIVVQTDSVLRDIVSTAYVIVQQEGTTMAIANTNVIDSVHLQVVLSDALTGAFDVTILMEAFKSPQTDAGPYHCNTLIVDLGDYGSTINGMTEVAFSSDDGSTTFNIPEGFNWSFNYNNITNVVISGNSWMGLGRSSEDVKVNRRDTYIQHYYYQVITALDNKVLKLRWEGWSPYGSRDDAHKFIWELFLIDNGDAYIHFVSKGGSTTYDGAFTFNGVSFTLNDSNKDVSFERAPDSPGTAVTDWSKTNETYVITKVV